MNSKYTTKGFVYTNPQAYDDRIQQPIEQFIASLWDPILLQYINRYVQEGITVADLGCGTFVHTQHMGKAALIYAVDINEKMLEHGKSKIAPIKDKVTVLCESGTHTSIPDASCDLVWIDGLSEFLNLNDLFDEVKRISKPTSKFIILYQNSIHPENALISLYYWITGRRGKRYRSLSTFKETSKRYGFQLDTFESTAVFFYLPPLLQQYCIPLWRVVTKAYQPLQKYFPIGNNIICVFSHVSINEK